MVRVTVDENLRTALGEPLNQDEACEIGLHSVKHNVDLAQLTVLCASAFEPLRVDSLPVDASRRFDTPIHLKPCSLFRHLFQSTCVITIRG